MAEKLTPAEPLEIPLVIIVDVSYTCLKVGGIEGEEIGCACESPGGGLGRDRPDRRDQAAGPNVLRQDVLGEDRQVSGRGRGRRADDVAVAVGRQVVQGHADADRSHPVVEGLLDAEVVDVRLHLGDRREVVAVDRVVDIIVVVEVEEDAVLGPRRLVLGDLEVADRRINRRGAARPGGGGGPGGLTAKACVLSGVMSPIMANGVGAASSVPPNPAPVPVPVAPNVSAVIGAAAFGVVAEGGAGVPGPVSAPVVVPGAAGPPAIAPVSVPGVVPGAAGPRRSLRPPLLAFRPGPGVAASGRPAGLPAGEGRAAVERTPRQRDYEPGSIPACRRKTRGPSPVPTPAERGHCSPWRAPGSPMDPASSHRRTGWRAAPAPRCSGSSGTRGPAASGRPAGHCRLPPCALRVGWCTAVARVLQAERSEATGSAERNPAPCAIDPPIQAIANGASTNAKIGFGLMNPALIPDTSKV